MWTNSLPPELLNTVHCMDCLEFMKTLPDGCVDLVLTDPPYWINADKGFGGFGGFGKPIKRREYIDERDSYTPDKEVFDEILRISKNCIIFWWNFFTDKLPVNWHWIFRDKNNTMPTFSDWELAYTNFDKKSVKKIEVEYNWLIGKEPTRRHPTQKPVKLFRRILENYAEQWMTVLDCFAWSWTTWVACKELWRNYILVEKEPKYWDIIHKRLQNTTVSLFHS